jgi:acetyltransferase
MFGAAETPDRITRPQAIGEALYGRLSVDGAAALEHRRSANFDAVRAIAALMVLGGHAYVFSSPGHTTFLVRMLSSGISLFFVLSGFLIAGPFLRAMLDGRRPPSAARYAVRRAARILPAYWLALIGAVAFISSGHLLHWWQVPLHGLLMQDLVVGQSMRLLSVAWTLSVEAMFYVFVPLAAVAVWRTVRGRAISLNRLAGGVAAIGIGSIAWQLGVGALTPTHDPSNTVRELGWLLPNFLYAFCPGALIYLAETPEAQARGGVWAAYRRVKEQPGALGIGAVVLLAGATLVATSAHTAWVYALHSVPLALGGAMAVVGFVGSGPRRRAAARLLAPIGLISYGIYLWHTVVREVFYDHAQSLVPGIGGGAFAWPFQVVFLLGVTIPIALASWVLLERPLLRRTSAWDRRRRDAGTDSEPVRALRGMSLEGEAA